MNDLSSAEMGEAVAFLRGAEHVHRGFSLATKEKLGGLLESRQEKKVL